MDDFHSPGARIRPAQPDDVEALVATQRSAEQAALGHVFPQDAYPYPTRQMTDRWRNVIASGGASVLLAERGNRAVGLACVRSGWLRGMFVVPEAWGSGVADRLHAAAMAVVGAEGEAHCRLWVLEENPRARRFYGRHGWRRDGRRQPAPYPPYPVEVGYTLALDSLER